MADKPRDYNQELAEMMNAMAESTLESTDEEIEYELKEEGLDPDVVAAHTREILLGAVKACRQRLLAEAQKSYDESIAAMKERKYEMPVSPESQREMINSILASNPQFGGGLLTAQNREFENLPDEDLEGYLRQLLELIESAKSADSQDGQE